MVIPMSNVFDSYKARLLSAPDRREHTIRKIQNKIVRQMIDHPSKKPLYINDSEEPVDIIVIDGELKDRKEIRSIPGGATFKLSDRIFFADAHWIVMTYDSDTEIYTKGQMRRCDLLLRWQDLETLEIIERLLTINYSNYEVVRYIWKLYSVSL